MNLLESNSVLSLSPQRRLFTVSDVVILVAALTLLTCFPRQASAQKLDPNSLNIISQYAIGKEKQKLTCFSYTTEEVPEGLSVFVSKAGDKKYLGKKVWTEEIARQAEGKLKKRTKKLRNKVKKQGRGDLKPKMKRMKKRLKSVKKLLKGIVDCLRDALNDWGGPNPTPTPTPGPTPDPVRFEHVEETLENECLLCHNWGNTEEFFLETGRVVEQSPEDSPLYMYLQNTPENLLPGTMPRGMLPLEEAQILMIREWIRDLGNGGGTPRTGEQIYEQTCARCHGPLATSDKRNATFNQIRAAVGPQSHIPQMRGLPSLSDNEILSLVEALRDQDPVDPTVVRDFTPPIRTKQMIGTRLISLFGGSSSSPGDQQILNLAVSNYFNPILGGFCLPDYDDYCGTGSESQSMSPLSNAVRTGGILKSCEEILDIDEAVQNALGKVGLSANDPVSRTNIAQLMDNLFFPGRVIPGERALQLANFAAETNFNRLDQWRFVQLALCSATMGDLI